MGDVKIPKWLKKLPLAPEFHPTDTEFADPIAYISKIEKEASAFGICKVIPPLPKPSKKYVYSNLNKSLMKSPELGTDPSAPLSSGDKGTWEGRAVFTTRQQELGHNLKRNKGQTTVKASLVHKQVWQSGEVYTLEQFESKSKVFAKNQLGGIKDVTPLLVEALFWKAASDKPIYIEYANDVPGSGFGEPEDLSQYFRKRRRRTKFDQECQLGNSQGTPKIDAGKNSYEATSSVQCDSDPSLEVSDEGLTSRRLKVSNASKDGEGTAGWKLSNCPWNLQIIARSPGSLTRFMLGDIPGVTSPMVYIGMLFSWFAWHVEDHELHSLNYLHTGSSKTWYAVPGDYAFTFEEIIRSQGYGGNLDRLAALALLGEKTNLLSPAVVVASGIPCCRLVQNPGEFVVTFPRAYHVGFSHGFNCGEAANFGTPQWLKVAKEAAIRRAAMNYLPMLSHQQLLYLLTMSFVSRIPRALLPGERSSRLKDRQKEERELLVKKAFIDDMLNEHKLLSVLLGKESTFSAVLWDPDSLSLASNVRQSLHISTIPEASDLVEGKRDADMLVSKISYVKEMDDEISNFSKVSNRRITADLQNANAYQNRVDRTRMYMERSEDFCVDDDDLPCGLHVDSGTLACVACGILGFPFMSIVQPSEKALKNLFPADSQSEGLEVLRSVKPGAHLSVDQSYITSSSDVEGEFCENKKQKVFSDCGRRVRITEASVYGNGASKIESCHKKSLNETVTSSSSHHQLWENYSAYEKDVKLMEDFHDTSFNCTETLSAEAIGKELNDTTTSHHQMWANYSEYDSLSQVSKLNSTGKGDKKWNKYSQLLRPRIFCLEHALETEKLLRARGGAHVLIICHSAYPKIKAHAMSAAEEIGASFDCDEVPLENASEEDLELINISICDEAHEEFSEDWTCRLGLNIHHCVKLRKLSQEKQEHALALGGLFSEPVSGSDISSLKWNSRRSRTSHKVIAQKESKSDQDIPIMKADIQMEKQERKTSGDNKFVHYYKRKRRRDKVSPGYSTNQQLEKSSGINRFPDSGTPCSVRNTGYVSVGLTKCTSLEFGSRHEETRDMMSDQANFAGSPAIQNEGNDSHKLETFATVEKMEIMPVPKTAQTKDVNEESDHAHSLVLFDMDNTGNDAVESFLVDSKRPHNREKKGVVISDPVTCASSHAVEDMGSDFHELVAFPTVENLEILDDGLQTGELDGPKTFEMTEKYKLHDTGNAAVIFDGAGNDIMESGEMPLKVTSMADEIFDSAKSAVSRVIHDLVLQSLGTQMKIQVLEEDDYEKSCEMQHASRTADDAQCDRSDPGRSSVSPTISTSSTQNFDAKSVDGTMGETDVGDEGCGVSSETFGRPQHSPTTSRMESGEGETITVDEVHRGEGFCSATMDTLVPESTPCHRKGRDQNNKKRRVEQITEDEINYDAFIRSPCERLRPRNQKPQTGSEIDIKVEVESKKARRSPHSSSNSKTKKEDTSRAHTCDVEGCEMSFDTSSELAMHKRNWCTHEGCDKRFTSHKYVTLHQKVHLDDRPLKCPWKDCKMSFKWAWARTEHIRVHTGERPYRCKVEGCGLTFRYVSDFSRHRRKTGHHSNTPS